MTREKIFEIYHNLSENPTQDNAEIRNMYFMVISLNGWMDEYNKTYPNEFGL